MRLKNIVQFSTSAGGSSRLLVPRMLELLLFAVILWTGWTFIHQPDAPTEHVVKVVVSGAVQSKIDIKSLTATALFGKAEKAVSAPVVKRSVNVPVAVSQLQLKLKGTVLAREKSVALVQPKSGADEGVFAVGDSILPGVSLVAVNATYILIDDHGKREKVEMEEGMVGSTPARPGLRGTARQRSPHKAGRSTGLATATAATSNQESANAHSNFLNMVSLAGLTPLSENGKFKGMAINHVIPGGLFSKIGLSKGDVIQSMNGKAIRNTQDARQAYNAAKATGNISIVIIRDGQSQTIDQPVQ